ncbi:hypothetical protein JB92DRAFT_2012295 [Gautieria morchelliformis]|nr:hypothetical protein JB92DRAFT_2012295 [Gautieria morchelliformis]
MTRWSLVAPSQERNFIMSPLGFYIICLLASNFITALGGIMEAQWVGARAITEGPACTTQAFTLQLGNNAAALWTAVISVSALRTFVFRARPLSKSVAVPVIAVLWIGMIVFDGLASTIFADHSGSFFYGVANMWCWITPTHRTARLAIQYVWMWVSSFLSAVCFVLVFLSVRGHITVKRDGQSRSVRWNRRAFNSFALGSGEEQYGALVGNVGKTMCWLVPIDGQLFRLTARSA